MMNKKIYILIIIIIALGAWYYSKKVSDQNIFTPLPASANVEYKNTEYGFSVSLPESWRGYSVALGSWRGDSLNIKGEIQLGTQNGPTISVRHPKWTNENPRQDIPVMIFTLKQWDDMQGTDGFHIGAAPTNPSELGRNGKYVFGLPARYNFAYLTGYEEVDQIIKGNSFKAE